MAGRWLSMHCTTGRRAWTILGHTMATRFLQIKNARSLVTAGRVCSEMLKSSPWLAANIWPRPGECSRHYEKSSSNNHPMYRPAEVSLFIAAGVAPVINVPPPDNAAPRTNRRSFPDCRGIYKRGPLFGLHYTRSDTKKSKLTFEFPVFARQVVSST